MAYAVTNFWEVGACALSETTAATNLMKEIKQWNIFELFFWDKHDGVPLFFCFVLANLVATGKNSAWFLVFEAWCLYWKVIKKNWKVLDGKNGGFH